MTPLPVLVTSPKLIHLVARLLLECMPRGTRSDAENVAAARQLFEDFDMVDREQLAELINASRRRRGDERSIGATYFVSSINGVEQCELMDALAAAVRELAQGHRDALLLRSAEVVAKQAAVVNAVAQEPRQKPRQAVMRSPVMFWLLAFAVASLVPLALVVAHADDWIIGSTIMAPAMMVGLFVRVTAVAIRDRRFDLFTSWRFTGDWRPEEIIACTRPVGTIKAT